MFFLIELWGSWLCCCLHPLTPPFLFFDLSFVFFRGFWCVLDFVPSYFSQRLPVHLSIELGGNWWSISKSGFWSNWSRGCWTLGSTFKKKSGYFLQQLLLEFLQGTAHRHQLANILLFHHVLDSGFIVLLNYVCVQSVKLCFSLLIIVAACKFELLIVLDFRRAGHMAYSPLGHLSTCLCVIFSCSAVSAH